MLCLSAITAVNGTAKVGEDVASRYAKQVQFNPGKNRCDHEGVRWAVSK